MNQRDILALVDGMTPGIDAAFQKAIAPLLKRVVDAETLALELGERLKLFEDRPAPPSVEDMAVKFIDRAMVVLDDAVKASVETAMKALPVPKDGKDGVPGADGKDGAPGPAGPQGGHGKDGADGKDGAPGIDGKDGQDGAPGADGKTGQDGESGAPGIDGAAGLNGKDGAPGLDGVGLADLLIEQDGILVATFTDGRTKKVGRVVGKDGAKGIDGAPGVDGKDGAAGRDVVIEDVVTLIQNEVQKQVMAPLATAYKGVWKPGTYKHGDAVTWNGSIFIANADNDTKPEDGEAWKLAVKRGRDGKDVAEMKAPAKVKL